MPFYVEIMIGLLLIKSGRQTYKYLDMELETTYFKHAAYLCQHVFLFTANCEPWRQKNLWFFFLPWLHGAKQAGKSQLLRRYLHRRIDAGKEHSPQKWRSFMASNGLVMITGPLSCYSKSMTLVFVSCLFIQIQHIGFNSFRYIISSNIHINMWQVICNIT